MSDGRMLLTVADVWDAVKQGELDHLTGEEIRELIEGIEGSE